MARGYGAGDESPRNRVIDERTLVNLVRKPPYSTEALQHAGMTPRQIRKFGDGVLDAIDRASRVDPDGWPPSLPEAAGGVNNEQLKVLKRVVAEQAERLGIAPEILAKRRQLEELLRSGNDDNDFELPASLAGWRRALIGDALLEALRHD
ncbi:MAG: HRDC domain-containing protein [Gammaproteobacteria bacterium]|nr:HRDC domain-containing protein [Gammaproteobacteria bacterium]